jgi:hypothetical protein
MQKLELSLTLSNILNRPVLQRVGRRGGLRCSPDAPVELATIPAMFESTDLASKVAVAAQQPLLTLLIYTNLRIIIYYGPIHYH